MTRGHRAALGDQLLGVVTRGLLRAIEGRGLDRAALLREAGLAEEALDPDRWVPIARHLRLGQAISAALPGQNLGLETGAPIYSEPRGALGYSLRRSELHRRALDNFAAYVRIVNRAVRIARLPSERGVAVVLEMAPELERSGHPVEALFGAWVSISRYLTATAWQPETVELRHAPIGDPREHERLFGCPVLFGAVHNRMLVPESAARLAIPRTPHDFERGLRSAGEAAEAHLGADAGARERLHALLQRLTAGALEVDALARDAAPESDPAAWHPARLALARGLIETSAAFVHEAAFLLGFDDMASFERAFERHFGTSAAALRVGSRPSHRGAPSDPEARAAAPSGDAPHPRR